MSTQSRESSGSDDSSKHSPKVVSFPTMLRIAEDLGKGSGMWSALVSVGTARRPTSSRSPILSLRLDAGGKIYSGTLDLPLDEETSSLLLRMVSMITSNLQEPASS